MSQNFQLISAEHYFDTVCRHVETAQKRVVIHAMVVLWQPSSATRLVPLLKAALGRGATVTIVGDAYSKLTAITEHPFENIRGNGWQYTASINRELQRAGAKITYAGSLGVNPFSKRCHSKITIVDDVIFSFGGINFYSQAFVAHDYMLKTTSPYLADVLSRLVQDIASSRAANNIIRKLDVQNTILFDAGNAGDSVIYNTALQIVSDAKKVYFVSQMCPTGPLASVISATDSECYFTRPRQASPPIAASLVQDALRYRIKNHYKGSRYLHAKFILTEGNDGNRHVISGSHNFNWRGVDYGTKEIALHSTDPALWQILYDYLRQNIIKSKHIPQKQ